MTNHLYYGDNLQVLRECIATESVDLVYLDPTFNSKVTYNCAMLRLRVGAWMGISPVEPVSHNKSMQPTRYTRG